MWKILFTKNAEKDKRLLKQAGLDGKSKEAKLKNEKTELLGFSMTSQFQNARSMEREKTRKDEWVEVDETTVVRL